MQFTFHYRKSRVYIYQLIILGAFSLALIGTGIAFVNSFFKSDGNADRTIFAAMATAFSLVGIALLIYAIYYYRKMKLFYNSREWYGVTVREDAVYCKYFEALKTREWKVDTASITEKKEFRSRNRLFYLLATKSKKFIIPLYLLDGADYHQLKETLNKRYRPA